MTETPPTAQARPPRRRILTVALIASLAFNALLAGYVAVQVYRRYEFRAGGMMGPRFLQMIKRRLPAADQAVLDRSYQARESEMIMARGEYERAQSAVMAILARPEFDEAAFRKAVAEARDKRLRVADLGLQTLVDAVAGLSPEGRRSLVRRFRH